MVNITHASRSQDYLYGIDEKDSDGKVTVETVESAGVHAMLAIATAVRELAETVHLEIRRSVQKSERVPPVLFVHFTDRDGDPITIDVLSVKAVYGVDGQNSRIDLGGTSYQVGGTIHEVNQAIFQAVGAW